MKERPGDQPLPTQHDGPIVQELVLDDIKRRLEIGIERYGTGLQANNGRDMLLDAYEEALDLAIYLRGALLERDDARDTMTEAKLTQIAADTATAISNRNRAIGEAHRSGLSFRKIAACVGMSHSGVKVIVDGE